MNSNKILSFLSKIGDLFFLNILFLVCCIPIITIGAAAASLYHCTILIAKKEDSYIVRDFFAAFQNLFSLSTKAFLLLFIMNITFICDFYFTSFLPKNVQPFLYITLSVLFIFFILISVYIFPVIAHSRPAKISLIIKESFCAAVQHVCASFLIAFMNFVIPFLILLKPDAFLFFLPWFTFLGCSGIAYTNSRILLHIRDKTE